MSQDFKNRELPLEHDDGQQLAAHATSDADTGQTAPSGKMPQEEDNRPPVEGGFKMSPWAYSAIVNNQREAEWWPNRDDLELLREWSPILIKDLNLRVKDAELLGVPLIKIEKMNVRTPGAYCPKADGYAIAGTIVFNEEWLRSLDTCSKLALLLKLLVRAWEHQHCRDENFACDCRKMMKAKGLVITEKGKITIAPDGEFRQILMKHGIEPPVASEFKRPQRRGKTTLRLWSCLCQRCRVGTEVFLAVCTQCNQPFQPDDHVGKRFVS